MVNRIYWLDGWNGQARGGVFVRCNLKQCLKGIEDSGTKIVGIIIDENDDMNLELVMEKKHADTTES